MHQWVLGVQEHGGDFMAVAEHKYNKKQWTEEIYVAQNEVISPIKGKQM